MSQNKKVVKNGITAHLLPSGNWNAKVRVGNSIRSVTAPTSGECISQATEMKLNREHISSGSVTLADAIDEYIGQKKYQLSPATIKTYLSYQRNWLDDISSKPVRKIDTKLLNTKVVEMSEAGLSAKYITSLIRFVEAVVRYATDSDITFRVTLPRIAKERKYLPTADDLKLILSYIREKAEEGQYRDVYMGLYKAVILGICINDRRGQIAALRGKDLDRDNLLIHSYETLVEAPDGTYIRKAPKTDASARSIRVPAFVFDILGDVPPMESVTRLMPYQITNNFRRVVNALGLPDFSFHDLRHFNASLYNALNFSEAYSTQRGGWQTPNVMRSVYTGVFGDVAKESDERLNQYYTNLLN